MNAGQLVAQKSKFTSSIDKSPIRGNSSAKKGAMTSRTKIAEKSQKKLGTQVSKIALKADRLSSSKKRTSEIKSSRQSFLTNDD